MNDYLASMREVENPTKLVNFFSEPRDAVILLPFKATSDPEIIYDGTIVKLLADEIIELAAHVFDFSSFVEINVENA